MPDIVSLRGGDVTNGGQLYQSKRYISFKVHANDHNSQHSVPQPTANGDKPSSSTRTPRSSGQKFSYTKNWGEVSDTLRRKLGERLSVLKESDDTSGDEDRTWRSESEPPPSRAESRISRGSRDRSPEARRDALPSEPRSLLSRRDSNDSHDESVAQSRSKHREGGAPIDLGTTGIVAASRYLFGSSPSSGGTTASPTTPSSSSSLQSTLSSSSLSSATVSLPASSKGAKLPSSSASSSSVTGTKLNRTGTAFIGMQVSLSPRTSRPGTPKKTFTSLPAGRADTPDREAPPPPPPPRVVNQISSSNGARSRSATPEKVDYRSLASFLTRSATPERLSMRLTPRSGTPERHAGAVEKRSMSPVKVLTPSTSREGSKSPREIPKRKRAPTPPAENGAEETANNRETTSKNGFDHEQVHEEPKEEQSSLVKNIIPTELTNGDLENASLSDSKSSNDEDVPSNDSKITALCNPEPAVDESDCDHAQDPLSDGAGPKHCPISRTSEKLDQAHMKLKTDVDDSIDGSGDVGMDTADLNTAPTNGIKDEVVDSILEAITNGSAEDKKIDAPSPAASPRLSSDDSRADINLKSSPTPSKASDSLSRRSTKSSSPLSSPEHHHRQKNPLASSPTAPPPSPSAKPPSPSAKSTPEPEERQSSVSPPESPLRPTAPKPVTKPVTHFVEVTSIEDGQKRITYVENGVTVEPVVPRKNRGTFTKKKRRMLQREIIEEADEEKESLKLSDRESPKTGRSPLPLPDEKNEEADDKDSHEVSQKAHEDALDVPNSTEESDFTSSNTKESPKDSAVMDDSVEPDSLVDTSDVTSTKPDDAEESSHYEPIGEPVLPVTPAPLEPASMACKNGTSEHDTNPNYLPSPEQSSSMPIFDGTFSRKAVRAAETNDYSGTTRSLSDMSLLGLPGPSTGAIPKRRNWRDTQVVKFPKDRSRGRSAGRADVEELRGPPREKPPRRQRVSPALVVTPAPPTSSLEKTIPDEPCADIEGAGEDDSGVVSSTKLAKENEAIVNDRKDLDPTAQVTNGEKEDNIYDDFNFTGKDTSKETKPHSDSADNAAKAAAETPTTANRETDHSSLVSPPPPHVSSLTQPPPLPLPNPLSLPEDASPPPASVEVTRPVLDAEIASGNVALKQALYESISEEQRRVPEPTATRKTKSASAESNATEEAKEGEEERNEGHTADENGLEDEDDSEERQNEEDGGSLGKQVHVYRIRRSALEALRYRIPQLRDIIRTRFRSTEISITNGNGHPAATPGPDSPAESHDLWSERPLDSERLGAESDSEPSNHSPDVSGDKPPGPSQDDGKHSLLQYAMLHFRDAEEKYNMLRSEDGEITGSVKHETKKKGKKKEKKDWTWREQVEMVKWTNQPLAASLLKLESAEMNKQALECFLSIQRYMGDQPMAKNLAEVDCVYTILMACHRFPSLRDEVYCQLMRQTTSNKSSMPDSCQRGWRLFSIVAAYFACSDGLRPYLFKYLETAAYDRRRAYHGTAMVCLQNLRKTFKFGGRKNVPSIEEITAITAGRNSKRQIYRLPGGTERVINTKSTSVVQDIIEDICSVIKIRSKDEMEEFSLYCIVEGDTFTMPLAREEYILDVTTELQKNDQIFYLIFCRSVWYFPLRIDSPLYVEVVFNQIAPDYLEGLLLVMPGETLREEVVYDISRVAALLHRAADMKAMPTMKETKYLLPKAALMVRDIKPPQWVNMVQGSWTEVQEKTPMEAKASVLEVLEQWPLFGSSFFAVSRVTESREAVDHILALNRGGVHFLDSVTHETLARYPFSEVISTRKVKTEEGTLFLDMKYGNLMQQKVVRIQSDNAHEISRLIRQYISIEQKHKPTNGPAEEAREGQASR